MISEVKQLNLYGTLFYDKLATWIEEMPLNEYFNVKGLNLLKKKKNHMEFYPILSLLIKF